MCEYPSYHDFMSDTTNRRSPGTESHRRCLRCELSFVLSHSWKIFALRRNQARTIAVALPYLQGKKNISIIIHFIIWFLGFWTANVFLLHLVCNVLDFEVFCENFFLRLPPKASIVVKHLWRVTGARKPVITRPKGRLSHCSDILSG